MSQFRILKNPDGKPLPVNVENVAWLDYTRRADETAIYFTGSSEPLIVLGSMAVNAALIAPDSDELHRGMLELLAGRDVEIVDPDTHNTEGA